MSEHPADQWAAETFGDAKEKLEAAVKAVRVAPVIPVNGIDAMTDKQVGALLVVVMLCLRGYSVSHAGPVVLLTPPPPPT